MLAQPETLGLRSLLLALALLGAAEPAWGGGLAMPEQGARRNGMAAVVGRPDEPAAVYHNPAGLTLLDGAKLYCTLTGFFLDTSARLKEWEGSSRFIDAPVDARGYYPQVKPARSFGVAPMLVATSPLWRKQLVGAVSLYVANATAASFAPGAVTRYHLQDSYIVAGLGGLSLAYQVRPWLSVGAGLSVLHVRVYGTRLVFPILDGQDQSALLGSATELTIRGSGWAPQGNLGVLLRPLRRLTIGAAVISRSDVALEGPIRARLGPDALVPDTVLEGRQRTELLIPWTFLAGANLDVSRYVEVGGELRYYLYRQLRAQHTAITGLEPLLTALDARKDYGDSWQVAGGVRVHALPRVPRLEVMLGGHYDRTPAPPETVSLDSPTFTHFGVRGAVRYQVSDRFRLAVAFCHYWYVIPRVDNSITVPPTNVDGSGGNNIVTVSVEASLGRGLVK